MAALQCEICGGKLIGKPGGLFECEFCGTEYSTEWARAKIQEITGTVKVEGTVEITGTVKLDGAVHVEGNATVNSMLRRTKSLLEEFKWDAAKEVIHQVLMIEPDCGQALIYEYLAANKYSREKSLEKIRLRSDYEIKNWNQLLQRVSAEEKSRLENCLGSSFTRLAQEAPPSAQLLDRRHLTEKFDGILEKLGGYWIARSVTGELFLWVQDEEASWAWDVLTWPKGVTYVLSTVDEIIAVYPDGSCRAAVRSDQHLKQRIERWEDVKLVKRNLNFFVVLTHSGELKSYPRTESNSSSEICYFEAKGWDQVEKLWLRGSAGYTYEYAVGLTADGRILSTVPVPAVLPSSDIRDFSLFCDKVENWVKTDGTCYMSCENNMLWPDIQDLRIYHAYGNYAVLTEGGTWVKRDSNYSFIWQEETKDVAQYLEHSYYSIALHSDGSISHKDTVIQDGNAYVAVLSGIDWVAAVDDRGYIKMLYQEKKIPENAEIFRWKLFGSAETMEQEIAAFKTQGEILREQAARHRMEEKMRRKAAAEKHREEQVLKLRKEKAAMQKELAELKGFFSGKRRKEIEARLSEIEKELKGMR